MIAITIELQESIGQTLREISDRHARPIEETAAKVVTEWVDELRAERASEKLAHAEMLARVAMFTQRRNEPLSPELREELQGLGLTNRSFNAMLREGLSVDAIRNMTDEQLLFVRNVGQGTLAELRAAIERHDERASSGSSEAAAVS